MNHSKETVLKTVSELFDLVKEKQSKVDELQVKFDQHDQWLGQRNRDVQELNDIIAKHVAEKDELQKRVDALEKAEFKLAQVKAILQNSKSLLESILVKKLEQALKGEGQ